MSSLSLDEFKKTLSTIDAEILSDQSRGLANIKNTLETALADTNNMMTPFEGYMLPVPGTDISRLNADEIALAIVTLRAELNKKRVDALSFTPVGDVPRTSEPEIKTITTTSRNVSWCKVANNGFTPLPNKPSTKVVTLYDTATTTPTSRTWWRLDQFKTENIVIELHQTVFPCDNKERIARDLTLSWHLYCATDLGKIDQSLLANTRLTHVVDGISSGRYLDLWGELCKRNAKPLSRDLVWRVVRGNIISG